MNLIRLLIIPLFLISCGKVDHKIKGFPEKIDVVLKIDPDTLSLIRKTCEDLNSTNENVEKCIIKLVNSFNTQKT